MRLDVVTLQLDKLLEPKAAQGNASSGVLPARPGKVLYHINTITISSDMDVKGIDEGNLPD